MNKKQKSILTLVACIAALFIPTYIAIITFIAAQNAPVSASNVTKLEITDVEGQLFELSMESKEAAADVKSFIKLNDRAIAQPSLPEQLEGSNYFEFKYFAYDRAQVYKYYFSENPGEAYFTDAKGRAYHIAEEDATAFLSTKYATSLYTTASFPELKISDAVMNPTEAEWVYQTYGGDYVRLADIEKGAPTDTVYPMKGAFALNFETEPDLVTVTIRDNGTVIFDDYYSNIANADLEGRTIDVFVDAKWYETEDNARYGSATYEFKAKVLLPAVFYLGKTEIEPGEFVVISAKNVDDPSAIKITSEPDIGFTPTFFRDGRYVRALVPVSYDCIDTSQGAKSIKFTCSYGEVTQEMNLDIAAYEFGSSTLEISASIVSQTRTETTLKLFEETMRPIVAETSSEKLWDGTFLRPIDGGTLRLGFGRYVTISGTGERYRHQGVDYITSSTKSVLAVNNGEVVFVGYMDLTGHLVVVDHGWGLKSWYAHLSNPVVKVGDKVNKGDAVGTAGSTGFTERVKVHEGLSVYGVPVSPYDLKEEGILMTE